jgi:undecaprenyl-diphosphatase
LIPSHSTASAAGRGIHTTASSWLSRIGRHELGLLISLAAFAGGVWLFVALAGEVLEGDTRAFDEWLLLAMRSGSDLSDPIGPLWFEELARDVTALGSVGLLTFLTLAVAGFLWLEDKGRAGLFLIAAIAGGLAVSMLLKAGFDRPRPELVPHGSHVYTSSFPSGHSMMSAVVYLTLGALLARFQRSRRLKAYVLGLAALITFCVGASRVYLGVHWPTDVLAGWTAGAAWALACWMVARHLQRSGTVEEES